MADEIVNLFEVNIDTTQALKDLASSQRSVKALKDEIKELQKAEGDNSEEIASLTANLKFQQKELRNNTKLTETAITAQRSQNGSLEQLRAQLTNVSIQWSKLSESERQNTDEGRKLTKQKTKLTEALKAEEKATGDNRRNVGNYTDSIKDAIAGSTGFNTSLLTLAANPVVLTITAIVGLFKLFQSAASRSEKASANLNKVFAIFQGVLDGILNALVPIVEFLSEKIVSAFEDPVQSIKDLGNAILDNIINRFKSVLVFGDALEQLFKGNFKEAAKLGADAFVQFGTGVTNATDKIVDAGGAISEFGKDVVENVDKAIVANQALANSERELLRISKEFELQQLTFQDNAEKQRQIRDDEKKSIEERIIANERLGEILDEQTEKELALANEQLKFAQLKNQADGDTLKTQEAIYDAQIKIAEIEERITGQRAEQLTNVNSLLKEQEELEIAALERQAEREEAELNRQIENAIRSAEIEEERIAKIQEAQALDRENRLLLRDEDIINELETERQRLEMQKQQELDFAESIGADTTLIQKKYSKAKQDIDRAENAAKLTLAQDFANNIAVIAGKNTAVGKAAAIASATINTFQAATGAFSSLASIPIVGPALGAVAAAAAVASGIANIKKIVSVKSGLPGESGGGSAPSISAPAPVSTPSVRSSVSDDVNAGIVSRDVNTGGSTTEVISQPTLVVDQVTSDQNQAVANNDTATI